MAMVGNFWRMAMRKVAMLVLAMGVVCGTVSGVACGKGWGAEQPAEGTPQQLWEWEQRVREEALKVFGAEVVDEAKAREAMESLRSLREWLKGDQAKAAAKEITWLPQQEVEIEMDLARGHAALGEYEQVADRLERVIELFEKGVASAQYALVASVLEQHRHVAKAMSNARVKGALDRMRAKDPWARFSTDAFAMKGKAELTSAERVMGLMLFWSEAKYNFAYWDRVPELDWNQKLLEYLPRVSGEQSTLEYYRTLQEMCALLKDAHTNVYLPGELFEKHEQRPPVRTVLAEGRVFVTKVFSTSLEEAGLKAGQEIVSVDGVPAVEAGRKREKFSSASTVQDMEVRLFTYDFLRGDADKPLVLGIVERDGSKKELTLKRTGWEVNGGEGVYEFKMLEGNIAYVKATSFGDDTAAEKFAADFPQVLKADGLIFDVRLNGGGNSGVGWEMLRHVAGESFRGSKWSSPTYVGSYRAWQRTPEPVGGEGNLLTPIAGERFTKPVAVLTSGRTFSAAEDFVIVFKAMKRGVVVGTATGGSTGQPVSIKLPGGGSARFCSKRDVGPFGEEFVGKGIQPDVVVELKAEDVREGRDRQLERAVGEVRANSK